MTDPSLPDLHGDDPGRRAVLDIGWKAFEAAIGRDIDRAVEALWQLADYGPGWFFNATWGWANCASGLALDPNRRGDAVLEVEGPVASVEDHEWLVAMQIITCAGNGDYETALALWQTQDRDVATAVSACVLRVAADVARSKITEAS
jgi:hypothetical protein